MYRKEWQEKMNNTSAFFSGTTQYTYYRIIDTEKNPNYFLAIRINKQKKKMTHLFLLNGSYQALRGFYGRYEVSI